MFGHYCDVGFSQVRPGRYYAVSQRRPGEAAEWTTYVAADAAEEDETARRRLVAEALAGGLVVCGITAVTEAEYRSANGLNLGD